jgi:hypothetical protein
MSLDALIMFAGAVVAALPFLGFPRAYLEWLLFIVGICVFALGIAVRRRLFQKARTQKIPFDESTRE